MVTPLRICYNIREEGLNMNEIWKDIKGYEGMYQISNIGRVKSLKRITRFKNRDSVRIEEEKILKLAKHHKGYLKAQLRKNDKLKRYFIHRLVAEAFIPNPHNKETVNHKDGDKSNNTVENLEWMTNQENMKHAYDTGIRNNDKVSVAKYKPVAQFTKDGTLISTFVSVKEAVEKTGIGQSNISACCLGRYKTTHGYVFKYI
jgi:hypothetical protein